MVLDSLLALLYNLSVVVLVVVTICELYRAAANKELEKVKKHLEFHKAVTNQKLDQELDNRIYVINRLQEQIADLDKEVGSIAECVHELIDDPLMDEEDELAELFAAEKLATIPPKKVKPKSSKPAVKKPVSKSKAKK